ncbi:MAG TPA: hypothetical protein VH186_01135 [Chloroflexia bacterium]|nr:hypothetical protein [Chloroflexia bacterium]
MSIPQAGITHDVVVDGQGYMLAASRGAPGYHRAAKSAAALGAVTVNSGAGERLAGAAPSTQLAKFERLFWDNWQGSGAAFLAGGFTNAAKRGQVKILENMRPVLGGSALALAPRTIEGVADVSALDLSGFQTVTLGNTQVVAVGPKLFTSSNPGVNNTGLGLKATLSGAVTGLAVWAGQVLVTVGGGAVQTLNLATGALTAFAPAASGTLMLAYQGVLVLANGSQLSYFAPALNGWTLAANLDGAIVALEELHGSLYVATPTTIYQFNGKLKPKSPASAPTVLDYFDYDFGVVLKMPAYSGNGLWSEQNFVKMTAWAGALWFMAGGRLYRAEPGGAFSPLKLEAQPVAGSSYGLGLCAGMLGVVVRNAADGATALWLNDGTCAGSGSGWWCVPAPEGVRWYFPYGNAGYSAGAVSFISDSGGGYSVGRLLVEAGSPVGFRADNFGASRPILQGSVTLPLLFPSELAGEGKAAAILFERIGVEWAWLDGGAWWPDGAGETVGPCQVAVEYSTDGGVSWFACAFPSDPPGVAYQVTATQFGAGRVEFPLSQAGYLPRYPLATVNKQELLPDPGWLLRINWSGPVMPLLRRIWLDYLPLELEPRTGLNWELELNLVPPVVGLNQASDNEIQAKLDGLWSAWRNGTTVRFEDIDGSVYPVKVVALEQKAVAPGVMPNLKQGWQVAVRLTEMFTYE